MKLPNNVLVASWMKHFLLTSLLLTVSSAQAETLMGRVIKVVDGDSITVLDLEHHQHDIRLSGIDAPEWNQPFGNRATQNLTRLLLNKTVSVSFDKHDAHGRIVGKVKVASPDVCPDANERCPKTLDVSMAQLTVGLAWWYRYYAKEQSKQDRYRYEFAEFEAKARKAGLWVNADPVPPWEWRRAKNK